MVSFQCVLCGIGQIPEQVEAISDLNRVWRSAPRSICVTACAITTDELDSRMGAELRCKYVVLAVRQQVDDLVLFKVDRDGTIPLAFTPGAISHTEDPQRGRRVVHR